MTAMAAVEILILAAGIITYIWRLQFTFPGFAILLLAFLIASFVLHRDSFASLGFGSRGFVSALRMLVAPTVAIVGVLILIAAVRGSFAGFTLAPHILAGIGRYFAWSLFQQFGLQSFFTNRLLSILKKPIWTAWASAVIFASFHIPNLVLMPATFFGGFVLAYVFTKTRNVVPLAVAHTLVGILLGLALPAHWHHGLRVGPGYYRFQ